MMLWTSSPKTNAGMCARTSWQLEIYRLQSTRLALCFTLSEKQLRRSPLNIDLYFGHSHFIPTLVSQRLD